MAQLPAVRAGAVWRGLHGRQNQLQNGGGQRRGRVQQPPQHVQTCTLRVRQVFRHFGRRA